MSLKSFSPASRRLMCSVAVLCAMAAFSQPAKAAFHLWSLNEVYTNNSGSLQFIELSTAFSSQQFVGGQQVFAINIGASITNTFTIPANLPGDSTGHTFLIGTAGLAAAGGPTPDFIMPNGFLFAAGGTINFFGANSGPYSALPTDGLLSRTWGGGNAVNSPKNFAGQTGSVPAPTSLALAAAGGLALSTRRRRSNANIA
jgi:hypothetical protein